MTNYRVKVLSSTHAIVTDDAGNKVEFTGPKAVYAAGHYIGSFAEPGDKLHADTSDHPYGFDYENQR